MPKKKLPLYFTVWTLSQVALVLILVLEPFQTELRSIPGFLTMALIGLNLAFTIALELFLMSGVFLLLHLNVIAPVRYAVRITLLLLLGSYLSVVLLSWIKRIYFVSFLNLQDIRSATYLFERATLELYLNKGEVFLFAGGGLILFLAAFLTLRRAAEEYESTRATVRYTFRSIILLLPLLIIAALSSAHFEHTDWSRVIHNFNLPQGRLLTEIFFAAPNQSFTEVPLKLQEIQARDIRSHPTQPDVIVIAVEALRNDVFQGSSLPSLQQIRSQGTGFRQNFAQASDTETSLVTMLTGQYPLRSTHREAFRESAANRSLFSLLKEVGYETAYFSLFEWKNMIPDVAGFPVDYFSDATLDGGANQVLSQLSKQFEVAAEEIDPRRVVPLLDQLNLDRLVKWLDTGEAPHLALWYVYATHFPYALPPKNRSEALTPLDDMTYYFPPEQQDLYYQRYLQALGYVDLLMRDLLEFLKDRDRETIVIFTGDHGEEFYEHGFSLHVGSLHQEIVAVPLVFLNLPCKVRNTDIPTGHVDIAPTLLDALGIAPYPGHQGVSLCSKVSGKRPIFGSSSALVYEDYVAWDGFKLMINQSNGQVKLYNFSRDPREQTNVFRDADPIAQCLKEVILNYRDKQLSYYLGEEDTRLAYYPPSHPATIDCGNH